MNGVRKNSGVIRLLMAAALVLFVAACGSSNSGIKSDLETYKGHGGGVANCSSKPPTVSSTPPTVI